MLVHPTLPHPTLLNLAPSRPDAAAAVHAVPKPPTDPDLPPPIEDPAPPEPPIEEPEPSPTVPVAAR